MNETCEDEAPNSAYEWMLADKSFKSYIRSLE